MLDEERRQQVEDLFRRFGKGVGSYVLARVGDAHAAESITSGIFLLVVRRIDQCRGSQVAWLWSIVRTEISRYFRDRRDSGSLETEPPDSSLDPRLLAERGEMDKKMRQALSQLTDEQQTLVYMKFFLDIHNTDIARALGMTPSNVGVVVHRAVKRLRDLMTADAPSVSAPLKGQHKPSNSSILETGANHVAAAQ